MTVSYDHSIGIEADNVHLSVNTFCTLIHNYNFLNGVFTRHIIKITTIDSEMNKSKMISRGYHMIARKDEKKITFFGGSTSTVSCLFNYLYNK